MAKVYIGLGSNLGDKEQNIKCALEKMKDAGLTILKVSSFVATKPYGVLQQPDFLNAVCLIQTQFTPQQLLELLKDLEKQIGRQESERWGPRIIDLDILLYDDTIIKEDYLCIPHADMLNRRFVLEPLAQIAPNLLHPVTGKSMKEHEENLK